VAVGKCGIGLVWQWASVALGHSVGRQCVRGMARQWDSVSVGHSVGRQCVRGMACQGYGSSVGQWASGTARQRASVAVVNNWLVWQWDSVPEGSVAMGLLGNGSVRQRDSVTMEQ
jgi:hypothetical protein